jgi:large-conductance mechanosensitive channel
VERFDRSAVIPLAVAIALGFTLWQVLSSISSIATDLLTQWWEDPDPGGFFGAELSIGAVQVQYGQLLASLITLLLGLLVAVWLLRYAERRRRAPQD